MAEIALLYTRDRDSKATGPNAADWATESVREAAGCQTPEAIHWGTHIRILYATSCGHPTPNPVSDGSRICVRTSTRTDCSGDLGTVAAERQRVRRSA